MFDIITVGSATVDVFVHTVKEFTHITSLKKEHDVCFPIGGKILIDHLTFDTGGGGTNTAVAFSRLGLKTGWLGKLGDDANSRQIFEVMKKEKVNFLGTFGKGHTGYSVIIVGLLNDRTILTHKGINDSLAKINFGKLRTKWFYFGSMLGESFSTLRKLAMFAKKNNIPYAFNPSTYLAKQGFGVLKDIIEGCSILVLNRQEAELITHTSHISKMFEALQSHAKTVVVTDGKNGAFAYDGQQRLRLWTRNVQVAETTGAGDAFAAGATYGLMKERSLQEALKIGLAEAEAVLQHIGAKNNLLTSRQLQKSLKGIRTEVF